MRLSDRQRRIILTRVVMIFGPISAVWLFGSRACYARRRCENTLLTETDNPDTKAGTRAEIALSTRLYRHLSDLRIDSLQDCPYPFKRGMIVNVAEWGGYSPITQDTVSLRLRDSATPGDNANAIGTP